MGRDAASRRADRADDELAGEHGWPIGIVDATPVGHTLRPAAATYPREEAIAEAREFLAARPYVARDQVRTLREHR